VKFLSILAVILLSNLIVNAQASKVPQLPAMQIVTEQAKNILSWTSQYDGIKSIAIQRSADSVRNFVTIGVLATPKKGIQTYTDLRPLIGKNSYRLSILFAGDVVWFSNTYKVIMDSEVIAKSIEEVIKPDTAIAISTPVNVPAVSQPTDFYFTPSVRIYTNPYSGHININLEDALSKKYSIRFFDPAKNEILRVSRIIKTTLILDKNNFNAKGTYSFQLFDGSIIHETGYITVY
jgi:hypothetical protein